MTLLSLDCLAASYRSVITSVIGPTHDEPKVNSCWQPDSSSFLLALTLQAVTPIPNRNRSKGPKAALELVPQCMCVCGGGGDGPLASFLHQDKWSGQPWCPAGNYPRNKIRDVLLPIPHPKEITFLGKWFLPMEMLYYCYLYCFLFCSAQFCQVF